MSKLPADYIERVYAGVLGKIIGVYLGRPFEGWTYERIMEILGPIEYYVHEKLDKPLIVTDDDISGTFTFVRALEDFGYSKDLTAAQIGQTWLNYIIDQRTVLWWGGMGTSTEHTAYHRLKKGVQAPMSGSMELNGQVVAEQIGAQIFIDGWAMVAPGDPDLAAELARRAGQVSHDGEAVYGGQVIAAMEAQAFVERDMDKLFDVGVKYIPADCVIRKVVDDVRNWAAQDKDWEKTFKRIQGSYLDEVWTLDDRTGGITVADLNDGTGSERHFYHQNTLYHVYALTDETGAIAEAVQSYDAYGNVTALITGAGTDTTWFTADDVLATNPNVSAIGNPYFYTGQRLDPETGLMYYKNRYYSPQMGRFIARDPIGYEGGSIGLYQYIHAKITRKVDPFGLMSCAAVGPIKATKWRVVERSLKVNPDAAKVDEEDTEKEKLLKKALKETATEAIGKGASKYLAMRMTPPTAKFTSYLFYKLSRTLLRNCKCWETTFSWGFCGGISGTRTFKCRIKVEQRTSWIGSGNQHMWVKAEDSEMQEQEKNRILGIAETFASNNYAPKPTSTGFDYKYEDGTKSAKCLDSKDSNCNEK